MQSVPSNSRVCQRLVVFRFALQFFLAIESVSRWFHATAYSGICTYNVLGFFYPDQSFIRDLHLRLPAYLMNRVPRFSPITYYV
ncbi:hypothetical protein CPC08DRAFT_478916 [Agrocybe pediades]|nr:hypothetical protein CPC08DRAFT_478916 [Agrocybe pediades]